MEDFEILFDAARSFNRYAVELSPPQEQPRPGPDDGLRPGEDYCRRGPTWEHLLTGRRWVLVGRVGEKCYWRRPGKDGRGWSATTGYCRSERRGDLLYVFSSNAPPFEPEHAYSKFEAFALLYHDGDYRAAARELQGQGFGDQPTGVSLAPRQPPTPASFVSHPCPEQGPGQGTETPGSQNGHQSSQSGNGNGAAQNISVPCPGPTPGQGTETKGGEGHEGGGGPGLVFRRVPVSQLKRVEAGANWLWHGYLNRNGVTLLSALWKAGKTTLLAHLLKALEEEGEFCGRPVLASRVLYVTEEHESKWAERRDELGLTDHIDFIIRPFHQKPTMPEWLVFLRDLRTSVQARPVDLLVFDVLSNLWPVRDENDATQVQAALMPLHVVAEDVALLLVHHLRKGDGKEATGSRGSGALTAFVDTIIELRRFEAAARKDRRRVLTGYGRYDETPEELVVELTEARRERYGTVFRTIEPARYVALGDHAAIRARQFEDRLLAAMPRSAPGLTSGQILEVLQQEHGTAVRRASLVEALDAWAEEGRVVCEGEGVRNDPYRYWTPPPDDHAVPAEAHSSAEGALLAALACLRAATAAQLADIAGLPLPEVEAALSALEARGEVLAVLSRENGRVYRDVGSLPEDES